MTKIHSTACVDNGAQIGDGVMIGPYCVIGPDVVLGEHCELVAHVHVTGHTTVGARTRIAPFASLGTPPQSVKYRGGPTRLVIGGECDIREGVTMNTGTEDHRGVTQVGVRGLFMANAHIGHDCVVGADVVMANCATLGGHCEVGDHVFIGGMSAAHQYTRIGAHAMIAGMTGLRSDVIPFGLAIGAIGRLGGLNVIGLKRRKFTRQSIHALRSAYNMLFSQDGVFADRINLVEKEHGADANVREIIRFIRDGGARPLCRPGDHQQD